MGRSTKLSTDLGAKIFALYEQGHTDKQVAEIAGVSVRSLHYWKRKHPWFLHSLKEAKDQIDDLVETALLQRALGYSHPEEKIFCSEGMIVRAQTTKHHPPDVTAQIFWLKNRRPKQWRDALHVLPQADALVASPEQGVRTFAQFCTQAGYYLPFAKQEEMREFVFGPGSEGVVCMVLGSRGYGKTDYITALGLAYEIYLDRTYTGLIITKSKTRNTAILGEIANALIKNGVALEKNNSSEVRVKGLIGKDSSASVTTIKSVSLRGRHPRKVLMDDPVTPDDVTEAPRKAAKRCYDEVVKLTQSVAIIGQPVHQFDLYEELRPKVRLLEVPFGSIPELDPDLEAMKIAGVSAASISASYHLKVLTEGSTPFDGIRELKHFEPGGCVAFIDPSHEGGDYTALTIARGYMDGVAIVGFVWKRAWNHCLQDLNGEAPGIISRLRQYGVEKMAFETNGLGDEPINILRQLLGASVGVVGRRSNSNKHSRIMAAGAYAHLIHLATESDSTFKDQVIKYEYKAKHDDAPDSLATCLEWIGLLRGKL